MLQGEVVLERTASLHEGIRSQLSLAAKWRGKPNSAAGVPLRAAFSLEELAPWMGSLNLVEIIGGGEDFRYLIYGTVHGQQFGDMTGRLVSDMSEPRRSLATHFYRALLAEPCVTLGRQSQWTESRFYYVYRLGLPLSSDGTVVDRALVHVHVSDQPAEIEGAEFVRLTERAYRPTST